MCLRLHKDHRGVQCRYVGLVITVCRSELVTRRQIVMTCASGWTKTIRPRYTGGRLVITVCRGEFIDKTVDFDGMCLTLDNVHKGMQPRYVGGRLVVTVCRGEFFDKTVDCDGMISEWPGKFCV